MFLKKHHKKFEKVEKHRGKRELLAAMGSRPVGEKLAGKVDKGYAGWESPVSLSHLVVAIP